jgi:hypothetical protein
VRPLLARNDPALSVADGGKRGRNAGPGFAGSIASVLQIVGLHCVIVVNT